YFLYVYKMDRTVYNRITFYHFSFLPKRGCEWNLMYYIKRYFKVIMFVAVIVVGLIYFNVNESFKGEVVTEGAVEDIVDLDEVQEEDEEVVEDDSVSEKIIIDIKGEINTPGVYEMQLGDRMIDIVDRAGGLTDDASETAINLAEKLQDEMAVIIPKEGDEPLESNDISSMESGASSSETDKINLNHATQSELETLNGIGPSKAEAIISYREENGLFQTVEDVLEVSGIGEKTLES